MSEIIKTLIKNYITYIWLVLIILLSIFLQLLSAGKQINNGILLTNTLDFSWIVDLTERYQHGFLAGRDFIFTYGPLYQVLTSFHADLLNLPSYQSILYAPVILTVITCIIIFIIARLITDNKKDLLFLFLYLNFVISLFFFPDPSSLIRIISPLLYSLLYVKFASITRPLSFTMIATLFFPAFIGLYTFDLFLLCSLMHVIFISYDLYSLYSSNTRTKKRFALRKNDPSLSSSLQKPLTTAGIQLAALLFIPIIISILLSKNLDYLILSLDMVRNYQFIESIPWSINKPYLLLIFPLSLCFMLFYFLKHEDNDALKRNVIFVALASFLSLKAILTRTDEGHLLLGVYPSIIILFIIFFFTIRRKGLNVVITTVFILLYLLIPYHGNLYSNISIKDIKTALTSLYTAHDFFSIYKFSDKYYYTDKDFKYFSSLISQNPSSVMVYPTDTYLLTIYGQTFNTLPVLFHNASASSLEKKSVDRLSQSPPRYIILGIDTKSAVMLDDIPNFSRNPYFTKWILKHYVVHKKTDTYLILRYDPNKKTKTLDRNTCSLYEVNVSGILHSNITEHFFKPSTFYLINEKNKNLPPSFRLPYTGNDTTILIMDGFDDPKKVATKFNITFSGYVKEKEEFKILKKYFFPKWQKQFTTPSSVKCF